MNISSKCRNEELFAKSKLLDRFHQSFMSSFPFYSPALCHPLATESIVRHLGTRRSVPSSIENLSVHSFCRYLAWQPRERIIRSCTKSQTSTRCSSTNSHSFRAVNSFCHSSRPSCLREMDVLCNCPGKPTNSAVLAFQI